MKHFDLCRMLHCSVVAVAALAGCTQTIETTRAAPIGAIGQPLPAAPYSFGSPSRLIGSDGTVVGEVRAAQLDRGVAFGFVAGNVPPGTYRLYIHSVGRCDPPDFGSAGPTWAPPVPVGYGIPDLGIVPVGSDGRLYRTHVAQGVKLRAQDAGNLAVLLDADGAALILHSPGGEPYAPPTATRRIACAVVR